MILFKIQETSLILAYTSERSTIFTQSKKEWVIKLSLPLPIIVLLFEFDKTISLGRTVVKFYK